MECLVITDHVTHGMGATLCRKSILEVEFLEEEGTGLGPTLEFFALVAAEFQRSGTGHGQS
jgi:hypothetical protein